MLHVGSGSVIPPVPFVSESQLVATICSRNRNAIVRITKEWPRARIATTPSRAANSAATTPAAPIHSHGEPPTLVTPMPTT